MVLDTLAKESENIRNIKLEIEPANVLYERFIFNPYGSWIHNRY